MLQVDSEQHRQLNFASRPNLQNSRKSTLLTAHSGRVARYRTRLQNKIETKQEQKRKQDYQKERGSRLGICQKIYTTQFSGERILHTENA